jgi:hypothetical protein
MVGEKMSSIKLSTNTSHQVNCTIIIFKEIHPTLSFVFYGFAMSLRNRLSVLQATLQMDAITKYSFPYLSFVKDTHGDGGVMTLYFVIYDIHYAL